MKIPTMLLGIGLLLVAACGSADGESVTSGDAATTEASVFKSADGVVNVVVPEGAAPASFVGSADELDASSIGINVESDQGVVLVYEVGTSGTTFNEPVAVAFRISPDLGNFDPALGVPVAILLIEDRDGGFQTLENSRASLDDGTLVLEGTTSHFSNVVAYISDGSISLEVGAQYEVGVPFRPKVVINSRDTLDSSITWTTANGHISVQRASTYEADAGCNTAGPDNLQAEVILEDSALVFVATALQLNPDQAGHELPFYIRADIECVEASDAETGSEEETGSSLGRNDDAIGDSRNMDDSTQVEEGGGEPGADITHVEQVDDDSGHTCFVIDVAGDGETAAAESLNHLTTVEAFGPDGAELWQARLSLRFGEPDSEVVWLGPKTSGRDTVEGATVIQEWLDSDTSQLCVDAEGVTTDFASFLIKIDYFGRDGNYYDNAEGTVE
jgi:hypothetical protein